MVALSYTECPGPDLVQFLAPVELLLRAGPHTLALQTSNTSWELGTGCDSSGIPKLNYSQPGSHPLSSSRKPLEGGASVGCRFFFLPIPVRSLPKPSSPLCLHTSILPSGPLYCIVPDMDKSRNMCEKPHHTGSLHAPSYFRRLREASTMPRDTA